MDYQEAIQHLKQYGQEHILKFYPELEPQARSSLLSEISSLELELIQELSKNLMKPSSENSEIKISPLTSQNLAEQDEDKTTQFENIGLDLLGQGKVAVFLVAGGQGTRLGHDGPKGTLDIGLPSGRTLFEIQADRLKSLSNQVNKPILWYIMTSPLNHQDTVDFFENHDYLGLEKENIFFFPQEMLPAVDDQGKILMQTRSKIALSPNGNGGCFLALHKSGALQNMREKGVDWLFFYAVDNALIKMADPVFVGYTANSGHPVGSKVVEKTIPEEKVGIFVNKNKTPAVMEYSDLPNEILNQRNDQGGLIYNCGNIAIHLFQRDFLEKFGKDGMPYHVAHKKIITIDENGNEKIPDSPNGYKFEMFMFDLFSKASGMSLLTVKREEDFAPVKNKSGEDSPDSARNLLLKFESSP